MTQKVMVLQRAFSLITVIVFIGLLTGIKCQRHSSSGNGGYRIPRPKATIIYPSGFRISIPDEQGIALFTFHGSINKNLRGNELGDFNADTRIKNNNNEWAFETTRHSLQPGDFLNFWIYVQHNNFGYRLENQNYVYPNDFVTTLSNTQTQNTVQYYEYVKQQEPSAQDYDKNVNGNPIWDTVNTQQQQQQPINRPQETQYENGNNNQNSYRPPSTGPTSTRPSYESNSNVYQEPNRHSSTRPTSRPAIPYTSVNSYEDTHRQTTRATPRPVNTLFESTNVNGYEDPYRQTTTSTTVRPRQTSRTSTRRTTTTTLPNAWSTTAGRPLSFNPNQNSNSNRDETSEQSYNLNQIQPTTGQNQYHNNNQGHNQNNQGQNFNSNHQGQSEHNYNNNDNENSQVHNRNCRPSITTMNGGKRVKCSGQLLFDEQFTGNVRSNWTPDIRMPLENEDAEFVLYHNYPSVWNVSNGNLHIYPKLLYHVPEMGFSEEDIRTGHYTINQNECTTLVDPIQECQRHAGLKRILPPIVTTKLRSKKSFSFKYGRVEIRAKLPKGDWLFPQLLLEPTQNVYRGVGDLPYLNGQIRIAFIHGNEYLETADGIPMDGKFLVAQTIVAPGDYIREISRKSIQIGQDHFGNDFHTYSVIWTNTSIKFIVDDLEYGSDTGNFKKVKTLPNAVYWESGTTMAPFDQEFHISLGVAAGGNADFPETSLSGLSRTPKPWENTSPKAELNFYLSAHDSWYSTWNSHESGLIVDYVKVYSV